MFSVKIQVLPPVLFHHEQAEDVKISTKADHEKKKKKKQVAYWAAEHQKTLKDVEAEIII